MLSTEEALVFVSERLEVGPLKDIERALGNADERLGLLNRIIRAYQHFLPFQNITLMSAAHENRHVPTTEEILASGLSLQGGVCFNLNVFMHFLLQGLGFDSYLIGGMYSSSGRDNNHVATVVKGLDPSVSPVESLHLVDVGTGYPTFEAVPLHKLPQTYQQVGLEFQFQQLDGQFVRLHRKGDTILPNEVPVMIGEWRKAFHFDPTPRPLDFFPDFMKKVFVVVENNAFFEKLRVIRFPSVGDTSLLAVAGEHLIASEWGENQKRVPIDGAEMVVTFGRHFPNIPVQQVEKALAFIRSTKKD